MELPTIHNLEKEIRNVEDMELKLIDMDIRMVQRMRPEVGSEYREMLEASRKRVQQRIDAIKARIDNLRLIINDS